MIQQKRSAPSVLMIAYTNYETDPRVIRAAEAAVEAGFAVDFLALRRAGQPAIEMVRGVRVIRLPQERYRARSRAAYVSAYLTFILRCLVASARLFAANRYKIVHVNNMPDVLVFSAVIPRLFGAKVILDIHDPMPETFGAKYFGTNSGDVSKSAFYRMLLWMEGLSVSFASQTVTVNEPVRTGILLKHGYRPETIDVVANFADERLFAPIPYPPIDGRLRFVFHGTILERYGLRTLVEAVAKVRHRDRLQVRIIGEGDFSATLRELISTRTVEDVIEFDNHLYPVHEIPRRLSDCHVGLVPLDVTPISDYALPLKLIEYTCLGLPSITVRSTAITHYLRPDECLFFTPGDSSELAQLLDSVAENPGMLEAYRQQLPRARERLSWTREKARYVAILQQLAGGVPHAPPSDTVPACPHDAK
jgi:glycosyltransferase involved in cell wall biosynthesis